MPLAGALLLPDKKEGATGMSGKVCAFPALMI